jgi:pSer/pThr/pTyr-binding forkhead associated (FHA) protein
VARKSVGDVRFPAGWIVVVEGPGRGAYFAVTNSVSSIGRGLDQSICLNFGDASISRNNHAAIAYDAEQNRFFLGHGNKSNIVRRNGQPVLSTEELMNGDAIRIGKTTLRFVALCGADFTWGPDPEEEHADAD